MKWKIFFHHLKRPSAQTTIEYVLLLSVVAFLMVGMGKRLKKFVIGSGNCPGPGMICQIQKNLSAGTFNVDANFRYFRIPH